MCWSCLYDSVSILTQYFMGNRVLQFSAIWSNLAVWFGRLVVYFRPAGFYLFGRPVSAVWASLLHNSLLSYVCLCKMHACHGTGVDFIKLGAERKA